jgi:hypothetical protein
MSHEQFVYTRRIIVSLSLSLQKKKKKMIRATVLLAGFVASIINRKPCPSVSVGAWIVTLFSFSTGAAFRSIWTENVSERIASYTMVRYRPGAKVLRQEHESHE